MVQKDNYDDVNWDDVTTWPWPSILRDFYPQYDEFLQSEFDQEMYNLLSYTHVSVRYDPLSVGNELPPNEKRTPSTWDVLGTWATHTLRNILLETQVPAEYVAAIDVGNIGVSFGSPAFRGPCPIDPEWYDCKSTGRGIMVCCS